MAFNNYDPANVLFSWNGIIISGYASGSMVQVERNEDGFSQEVGATGDVVDIASKNRSGKVTFNLLASSIVNDQLSTKALLDESFGTGVGALFLKELNGTTVIQCENARLVRIPNKGFAAEHTPVEWMLQCDKLLMFVGGLLT